MLPTDRAFGLMVQPLFFQEDQLGFVLFETNNRKSLAYETLQVQISSSLKGALLVEQEEKRALQLRTVAEISTATSTILDKTELLQQVVDLTKERFWLLPCPYLYAKSRAGNCLRSRPGRGRWGGRWWQTAGVSISREQSLIAEAARSAEVVIVDNVRLSKSWLFLTRCYLTLLPKWPCPSFLKARSWGCWMCNQTGLGSCSKKVSDQSAALAG